MLRGSLTARGSLSGSLSANGSLAGALSAGRPSIPSYAGPYAFEPAEEAQTARTGGYALSEDIVIQPIPSNYGRIAYNGSVITVY